MCHRLVLKPVGVIFVIVLALALGACNLTDRTTVSPTLFLTIIPTDTANVHTPTATPLPASPTGTPTELPPTTTATATSSPPTPTATDTPSPTIAPTATIPATVAAPTRVTFAPQATSATIDGSFSTEGPTRYVLRALAGQLMRVELLTPSSSAQLAIRSVAGTVLKGAEQGGPAFTGTLPTTGDYLIEVKAGGSAPYTLNIVIPERIAFESGTTSATVQGSIPAHHTRHYVLRASRGQHMRVNAAVPGNQVHMAIYGVDGTVLQSGMGLAPTFSGILPATQDYVIALSASEITLNYTLSVAIPERIRFQPGTTSAEIEGRIAAHTTHHYILRANANQTIEVEMLPSRGEARLTIVGVDGIVLKSSMGEGLSFEGRLPSSQDYIMEVSAGEEAVDYLLEVSIE